MKFNFLIFLSIISYVSREFGSQVTSIAPQDVVVIQQPMSKDSTVTAIPGSTFITAFSGNSASFSDNKETISSQTDTIIQSTNIPSSNSAQAGVASTAAQFAGTTQQMPKVVLIQDQSQANANADKKLDISGSAVNSPARPTTVMTQQAMTPIVSKDIRGISMPIDTVAIANQAQAFGETVISGSPTPTNLTDINPVNVHERSIVVGTGANTKPSGNWQLTCICGQQQRTIPAGSCEDRSDAINSSVCQEECQKISSSHTAHRCTQVGVAPVSYVIK